jgi:type II secretory pathway pseudopilin PulG
MKRQRRFLTLLETLIVLSILSLFVGLIGINVNKAVHEQRFRTEASTVLEMLRTAQYLMLILDNDVHVKINKSNNSINIHIETVCPLSPNWEKLITKPKEFTTIHIINFTDRTADAKSASGTIDIRFLSNGYVMSQGIMRLATAEAAGGQGGLESFICLPGYPSPLSLTEERPKEPDCFSLQQDGFTNMTATLMHEIQSLKASSAQESTSENESAANEKDDNAQQT